MSTDLDAVNKNRVGEPAHMTIFFNGADVIKDAHSATLNKLKSNTTQSTDVKLSQSEKLKFDDFNSIIEAHGNTTVKPDVIALKPNVIMVAKPDVTVITKADVAMVAK